MVLEAIILSRYWLIGCLSAVFGLFGASMCLAQNSGATIGAASGAPLLSVSAQESVSLQPVAVQLRVPFRVEGREGEEAISALREHRKTVEKL